VALPTTVDVAGRTLTAAHLDVSKLADRHHLVAVFATDIPQHPASETAGD
jgi:hypothetical protein